MKAFIVLALVACVAARSFDVDTLRHLQKEKSLLTKDDLLLKDGLFTNRFSVPKKDLLKSVYGYDYDWTVPTTPYTPYGYEDSDYTYSPYSWTQRRVTVLSIEELVSHPLFREYMQIPLFRQFWEQYPTIFRRYVESPLFQQFWTVPQFMQYFRNPIFFYKYIMPQVQMIAQSSEGVYNYDYGYNYNNVQDYTRRPFVGRDILVGDYLNKIFNHRGQSFYPYAYSTSSYQSPIFGRHFGGFNNGVNHKYLVDKIYRTLFLNKPVVGEVTEVKTDVKVAPAHKEVVVEPITGEPKVVVEKPKIVDVKVDQKVFPVGEQTEEYGTQYAVKEALLKKLLINKHITYELYQVLKTLPLHHLKEIVRRIAPSVLIADWENTNTVFGDFDDVTTGYPTHHWEVNNVDVNDVVYRHKVNEILKQLYNNEIVGDRYAPVVRDLFKTFGHHNTVYPREFPVLEDIVRA